MKYRNLLRAALIVPMLSGFTATVLAPSSASAHCKGFVTSKTIWAKNKNKGKYRARVNYQVRAHIKKGWSHRKWSKAKSRSYQINYNVGSNWPWRIRARANACN